MVSFVCLFAPRAEITAPKHPKRPNNGAAPVGRAEPDICVIAGPIRPSVDGAKQSFPTSSTTLCLRARGVYPACVVRRQSAVGMDGLLRRLERTGGGDCRAEPTGESSPPRFCRQKQRGGTTKRVPPYKLHNRRLQRRREATNVARAHLSS
jgi:hypothetical protein